MCLTHCHLANEQQGLDLCELKPVLFCYFLFNHMLPLDRHAI